MATGDVLSGGLSGAVSGGMIGMALGGPLGAAVGVALGGPLGGLLGGRKKKYKAPKRASSTVYGYDTYGNLVNKGSYSYNPATGQYELKAGELSGQEKAMRASLAQNIAGLINTVGTTPDAFVRYAKELSDTYYRQGERKLAENVAREQARLDESLARRGMTTSRAAADVQSELERRRQNTLADIYDASQRYGLSSQLQMQEQARGALGTLAGYQGQLMGQDMNYLQRALQAQQIGQQYENMAAGVANQNIAQENANVDSLLGTINQLGSLAGYYSATKAAQPSATGSTGWMQQGTQLAQQAGNTGFGTLGSYLQNALPAVPTIQDVAGSNVAVPNLINRLDGKLSIY